MPRSALVSRPASMWSVIPRIWPFTIRAGMQWVLLQGSPATAVAADLHNHLLAVGDEPFEGVMTEAGDYFAAHDRSDHAGSRPGWSSAAQIGQTPGPSGPSPGSMTVSRTRTGAPHR